MAKTFDPQEQSRLAANERNQEQPLRQRPVEEDQVPLATHVVKDGEVTERFHKPGDPLPEQKPKPRDRDREREQKNADKVRDAVAAEHPPHEVVGPAGVYAQRDNIVHPGPTVQAVAADVESVEGLVPEQKAAGDGTIEPDPELVRFGLDEDETAAEALDAQVSEAREQVA